MSNENLSFETQVEHLKTCHENEQSVIRFLDTKATAALTATFTLGGLSAAFVKWCLTGFTFSMLKLDWLYFGVFALLLLCIVYAVWHFVNIVIDAFKCINPEDSKNEGCSTLYLSIPKAGEWRSEATGHINMMTSVNANQLNILADYNKQLVRVGEILDQKSTHCKKTIKRLQRYLFALLAVIVVSLCSFVVIGGIKKPTPVKCSQTQCCSQK